MQEKNIFTFSFFAPFTAGSVLKLFILLLLSSCAQIVSPGGGAKDIFPPKVVKYLPDSAKLHFNSKLIIINFDEFIQLVDLNGQLIISPPMEKEPEISVKNKTLTIALDKKDTLKSNRTYCISFGNAIHDLNESNPIDNFRYIFSTGDFIDSLSIKGKVQNAFDQKSEKGILVLLYSDFNDSVVYKKLPEYFARTKDDGTFQINNIRKGKYKIVALKDVSGNYKYDGESESIGFLDTLIDPSQKEDILINLFQEPAKKLFLKKYLYESFGKILLVFNKGDENITAEPLNYTFKENDVLPEYSKNKDTINYWFTNIDKDSLVLRVKNGDRILDTVSLKIISKEAALKLKRNPLKLSLLKSPNGNQSFDLNSELHLFFSQPISTINIKKPVLLKEDSVLIKNYLQLSFYKPLNAKGQDIAIGFSDSVGRVKSNLDKEKSDTHIKLKEKKNYHLFIPPGTFTDIFGLTNDTIKIDFKTREEKFYGSLKLKMEVPETKGKYIVQLLDDKEYVVRESTIQKPETLTFDYLYPQNYKLKIINDENGNGKWDSGNYLLKQQPEKVIYYKEPITIRSNWDLDLEWNTTKKESLIKK